MTPASTLSRTGCRHVALTVWHDFTGGGHHGTEATAEQSQRLLLGTPAGVVGYADPYGEQPARAEDYEWGAWTSPPVETGFGATEVVPSWNAVTPDGSWLLLEARTAVGAGSQGRRWSRWLPVARWADSDREIHPTSVPDQQDQGVRVDTDVLRVGDGPPWTAYQLRVTLLRRVGTAVRPTVGLLAAVASRVPDDPPAEVSRGGAAWGVELPVPRYSQHLHRGEYASWDSGAGSWCSPTATSMLLGFHDRLPPPDEYAWVDPVFPDRFVVHAARHVYDYAYRGTGNWSFNTAYAARHGTEAFVTRLRSLAEAELLVAAGIPLAATASFTPESLTGAGYGTEGHLLVVVGFTGDGDVVCNDPASHAVASNDEVRAVFDRAEFERAWLGGSGGVVYVVRPDAVSLPPPPDATEPNW